TAGAGTAGAGTAGAGTAGAGTGGLGGSTSLPACVAPVENIEGCVKMGGALVRTALTASATVTAVADVPNNSCTSNDLDLAPDAIFATSSGQTRQIDLETAAGQSLSVFVRIPDLPQDRVKAGDTVDLSLDAVTDQYAFPSLNQTFSLSQSGALVLFVT